MAPPLTIRPAQLGDLVSLLALYRHLDPADQVPPLEVAARRLDSLGSITGSAVLIGLNGAELVASCTLVVIPNLTRAGRPYGLIENVVTHAAHRRHGHGKAMLRAGVEAAWRADCYKVMLMTGSRRPSTLAFYAAAGFEQSKTGFQVRRPTQQG